MHQLYQTITLTFITLILTACEGDTSLSTQSSSTETTTLSPSLLKVALDNMGSNVQKNFNEYEIKVLSDKNLTSEDETSQSTIALYGTIDGESTNALLKINSHYRDSNLTVEVYKNGTLLATKEALSLTNQIALDFGQIEIK